MRSRVIIVMLVSLGLAVGGARCAGYPRHVDPAGLALDNPQPLQLFELYGQVYEYISVGGYDEARLLLASAEGIAAPAGTLKLLSQYNMMLGSVIDSLNGTEGGLAEAHEHLMWLRDALAEESLAASGSQLGAANGTALELGSASRSLASALGYSPDVLLEGLSGISRLVDELDARILEGQEEVELVEAMSREDTFLGMAVGNTWPAVGSSISVWGSLVNSEGAGLGGRLVGLLLEDSPVGEAVTGQDGEYEYVLSVPYRYVDRMALRAEYWPAAEDRDWFAPSVSGVVYLSPVYGTPVLGVEAPAEVYPGRGFQVRGTLSYLSSPLEGVTVTVWYMGSIQFVVSGGDGGFAVDLATSDGAEEGPAEIALSSASGGGLGPASAVCRVQVTRVPLGVTVEGPLLVFSGLEAVVTGDVSAGGAPLRGCLVTVRAGGDAYEAVSGEDGGYSVRFPVGLLAPSSRRGFEVAVEPAEPWVRAGAVGSELLVVNSLVAAGLPLLALAVVVRRRGLQLGLGQLMQQAPVVAPAARPELQGLPGLYLRAVGLVGRVAGVGLRPSETVREYLGAVRPTLSGSVYSVFAWLSGVYERWFYGGRGEAPLKETRGAVERLRDEVEQDKA